MYPSDTHHVATARHISTIEPESLEQDQLTDEVSLQAAEELAERRRRNRVAAQRSRQRKKDYVNDLEEQIEALKEEVTKWKSKVQVYEALLISHNVSVSK